jgi:hypothetical protein
MFKTAKIVASTVATVVAATTMITTGAEAGSHYKYKGYGSYHYGYIAPRHHVYHAKPVYHKICSAWNHHSGRCIRWY